MDLRPRAPALRQWELQGGRYGAWATAGCNDAAAMGTGPAAAAGAGGEGGDRFPDIADAPVYGKSKLRVEDLAEIRRL